MTEELLLEHHMPDWQILFVGSLSSDCSQSVDAGRNVGAQSHLDEQPLPASVNVVPHDQ